MGNSISIALSGLNAASKQLQASASNVANVATSGSLEEGTKNAPYTPQMAVQETRGNGGVSASIAPRGGNPFTPVYDPDSPYANAEGFIGLPNVELAQEAVNSKLAELSYKANIQTLKVVQELSEELLSLFDEDA